MECCCVTVFCVVGTGIWSQVLAPFRCASESYSLGPCVQFSGNTTHARDNRLTKGGFLRSEFGKYHSMICWLHCSWAGTKVIEDMVEQVDWLVRISSEQSHHPLSTHPRAWRFPTCPSPQDSAASLWIATCRGPLGTLKIQTRARTPFLKAPFSRLPNMSLRRQTPTTSNSVRPQSSSVTSFLTESLPLVLWKLVRLCLTAAFPWWLQWGLSA